ncbi:transcriptional regulator [Hoyosella sp. G463]|uniref:Transcriptional regulator n=1 Tax=Lolliginicoccus lacisalsi TaxID=2742202 RepID=A0A927JEC3_9ACTN|nr:transcriptional regulator [Lolliginicoccus lacisalsi]
MDDAQAPHPRARLVDPLHHPVRFSLAAALAHADSMEFREARDLLQVSDSVLSKQASQLEAAGLVRIKKGHVGKRPRTWLSLTPEGHGKWRQHLQALQDIAEGRAP